MQAKSLHKKKENHNQSYKLTDHGQNRWFSIKENSDANNNNPDTDQFFLFAVMSILS